MTSMIRVVHSYSHDNERLNGRCSSVLLGEYVYISRVRNYRKHKGRTILRAGSGMKENGMGYCHKDGEEGKGDSEATTKRLPFDIFAGKGRPIPCDSRSSLQDLNV
jgi:hypothetical protein